jgi:hypothetical protein
MAFKYFPLSDTQVQVRKPAWDGLMNKEAFGWAAVMSCPKPDVDQISRHFPITEEIPLVGPVGSNPEWDNMIRKQIRSLHLNAMSVYEDDTYPAISIPRSIHGQSQCIAQIFGCDLIEQESEPGLYYPVPWIQSPKDIKRMKLRSIDGSLLGRAIEFAAYARAVTNSELAIRNPVMTGPIDSANYILGTMKLMQWIYDEPKALHELLEQITEIIIETITRLQTAAGGTLCPDHCTCLPCGYTINSEIRSLISLSMYNEFESPYLRRISKACGPYMIHSCGTWEQMLPVDMQDDNLVLIHFQTKEMDLKKVYDHTHGKLSMYVGESINLSDKYLWPCEADFYRYMMCAFPEVVPLSFSIKDMDSYLQVEEKCQGGTDGMFHWRIAV